MEARELSADALSPPSRHPLAAIGWVFVLGTWLGMRFLWSVEVCAAACGASLMAWGLLYRAARHRRACQVPSCVALGLAIGLAACGSAQMTARSDYESVETFRDMEVGGEDAVLRGRVVSEPTVTLLRHGGARIRFDFAVMEVPFENDRVDMPSARLQVDWYGPVSLASERPPFRIPSAGEGWQLYGRIREAETRSAVPRMTLRISRSHLNRRCEERDATPAMFALWRARRHASDTLSAGMKGHAQASGIVKAMTLGLRSDVPRDVMDFFMLSGTVHVFSISGLHVGIVASILLVVLAALPIPGRYKVLFYGPMIIAYTIATGAAASAIRACVMSLIFFSAPLIGRRPDPVSSISAAAIVILAFNPRQVMELGFMFSFVSAYGIIVGVPVLHAIGSRLAASIGCFASRSGKATMAELVDGDGLPAAGCRRRCAFRQYILKYFTGSVSVSLAAWAASTPITAMVFARITPVSILCNLVVIPLSILIVVVAALSMVVGLFSSWASEIFNHANLAITACMVWAAKFFSELPLASFETEPWGLSDVWVWYFGMAVLYFIGRAKVD